MKVKLAVFVLLSWCVLTSVHSENNIIYLVYQCDGIIYTVPRG